MAQPGAEPTETPSMEVLSSGSRSTARGQAGCAPALARIGRPATFADTALVLVPVLVPVLVLAVACAPETKLGSGAATGSGQASSPPDLPVAALLEPVAGATEVPPNLAGVTLRTPEGLGDVAVPVTVVGGAAVGTAPALGRPVALGAARPADCGDGGIGGAWTCLQVPLVEPLVPATSYVVSLVAGLTDGAGLPVQAGPVGRFTTAAAPDLTAPLIVGLQVSLSGPCVVVAFETDEPAAAELVLQPVQTAAAAFEPDPALREISLGRGLTVFRAATHVRDLPAGAELAVGVRVSDAAGNVAESAPVELTLPGSLVPLAITEIHANPAGPEPAQEYVELRNLGAFPIDPGGMALEDGTGRDVLPAATIGPAAYALVVPSGFDVASVKDTPPAAGTVLLRVDSRLGGDGLSNAGEVVRLRAADGALLSSYGSATATSTTAWSGKSIHRMPEDACDQPATWTTHPLAATPGWGPP